MKKNILICIESFEPAFKFGGPIKSVKNIISHFSNDFNFYVFTSNKDSGEILNLKNNEIDTWIDREKFKIYYSSTNTFSKKKFKSIFSICKFDTIYINSLFSIGYTISCLLYFKNKKNKILLSPRGMLAPGALTIKPLKKKIYLYIFKLLKLHTEVVWIATSDLEFNNIKDRFSKEIIKIKLAPNLSDFMKSDFIEKKKKKFELNLYYVSRIVQNKNLFFALSSLSNINPKHKVNFSIIGPIEDQHYWDNCQIIINKNNKRNNININYFGPMKPNDIKNHLSKQHVLLFPTLHENFGHVIMESWQSSCPVIISDKTPWNNLSDQMLGFDIDLSLKQDFVDAIENFSNMNQKEFLIWSYSCFKFSKKYSNNNLKLEKIKKIFN